jgi:ankyrin repeat protein
MQQIKDLPSIIRLGASCWKFHLLSQYEEVSKQVYITAWDFLLQPGALNHPQQVAECMRLLLNSLPHISHAESYAAKLFKVFPEALFTQLADVDLERCLWLVIKHFSVERNTPAYQFIVSQLPTSLEDPLDLITELKKGTVDSILLYLVGHTGYRLGPYKARRELLDMLFKRYDFTNDELITALSDWMERLSEKNSGMSHVEYLSIFQALLHHQTDINAEISSGMSLLKEAVAIKDLSILQAVLQHPQIDVNARINNSSALDDAIESGNVAAVKILLQHPNIDLIAKDQFGFCPLKLAIYRHNLAITKILLQHPQIKDNAALSALALNWAIERGYPFIIKLLLQQPQIDVNARDAFGRIALHKAITRPLDSYWADIVKVMLKNPRIDVNARDALGHSALTLAVCKGDLVRVHVLLQHPQIDVNVKDNEGISVLEKIIDQKNLDIVDCVAMSMRKVEKEHLDMLDLLLQHPKIDVNLKNNEGICVLEKAIDRKNVDIIERLLQHPQMIEVSRQATQRLVALGYVVQYFTLPVLKWLGFSFVTIGLANMNKTFQVRSEDSLH